MAVALLLAARPGDGPETETVSLEGRTSRGLPVVLSFVDGELRGADLKPSLHCPKFRRWESVAWAPRVGVHGEFRQDGSSFGVRHSYAVEGDAVVPRGRGTLVMIGELADDHDSARGTISATWVSPEWACRGTVRFNAHASRGG